MYTVDNKFEIGEECCSVYRERIKYKCPVCEGKGSFIYNNHNIGCNNCRGTGKLENPKQSILMPCRVKVRRIIASIWKDQISVKYKVDGVKEFFLLNINNRNENMLFKTWDEAQDYCRKVNTEQITPEFQELEQTFHWHFGGEKLNELDYEKYIGKQVRVKCSDKLGYQDIIGMEGIIKRACQSMFGVSIGGAYNVSSTLGLFWFNRNELNILDYDDESEDVKMEGFKNVAIVNLLDDCNKKDYAFALYDEERVLLKMEDYGLKVNQLVVVNAKGKDNRYLGVVKNVMTVEEYGKNVTAQVVGVVNMDAYNARVDKENRLKELAKKKTEIEKVLDAEIKRRKDTEYYEEMAKKYSDNPLISQLVEELKGLGV